MDMTMLMYLVFVE